MNNKCLNMEIDGRYCSKCKDFHPTLNWHEKYDDYLNKKEWVKHLNLKQQANLGRCVVCSTLTKFINIRSDNYVCSDECRYKDKGCE